MKKIFVVLSVLYFIAGITNLTTGILAPSVYKVWADSAFIPIYKSIMESFSTYTITIVMTIIFLYQMTMSYCFYNGRGKPIIIGLVMSILFHTIIIPWGLWSLPNIGFVLLSSILLIKTIKLKNQIN